MNKPKIYMAARYVRREEMEALVPAVEAAGWQVNARWVFGEEEKNGMSASDISAMDLEDVETSDALVIFTHPRSEPQPGGGRFVEMGYAMALNKDIYVIGPVENVFCEDIVVKRFDTVEEFLNA